MAYGHSVTLESPFDEALAAVRAALGEQGFGVVSEVDLAATLRAKLGVEVEPQVILGACNPALAHRALGAEPSIGLLLPCNVVVRGSGAATIVEVIDAQVLVQLTGNDDLAPVAGDVGQRLDAVLETLRARS